MGQAALYLLISVTNLSISTLIVFPLTFTTFTHFFKPFSYQFHNNKMLKRLATSLLTRTTITPLRFNFSGGEHHEIDYHAVVTKNTKSGYYLNPNEVARRISRVIAHFDGIKNVEKMNLNTQWWELGLNQLDYTELTVLVQEEFKIEFPDDIAQKFKDVNDMVEYVARSFWSG